MKKPKLIALATFYFLTLGFVSGQVSDSLQTLQTVTTIHSDTTTIADNNTYNDDEDFAPGLGLFALFGIGFIFVCVGAGVALTVFGLLILFGLISLGALSASVLVGLNRKSFATGFKTFLVFSTTIGGLIICGAGFWMLNKFVHWWSAKTAILVGVSLGFVAGLVCGLIAFYVLQRLTTFLKSKLNLDALQTK